MNDSLVGSIKKWLIVRKQMDELDEYNDFLRIDNEMIIKQEEKK